MKVVIIIPTFNERENIRELLDLLHASGKTIPHHAIMYLVVDDTSPDKTADIVVEYQKTHPDTYILLGKKEGLGKALLRGMTYAVETLHADVIGQMDADLSHDPSVTPAFIRAIDKGYDFCVGCRYIKGGSIPSNWGIHRKIFSIVGNAIVRFGLGFPAVHDWTGGYRVFRKAYYEKNKHHVSQYAGYVFQIAFLHQAILHGARIAEIPIIFTDRKFGHSKIAPSEYIRNVLLYVARERWKAVRHGPFGKFLIVGTIGFIINTIGLELFVYLRMHPAVASALGAEMAIISNFIFNNSWTFRDRRAHGIRQILKFLQFNLTSLGAILIQAGTVAIGTYLLGLGSYRLFYILGVLIGLVWNYTMYSRVIWRKQNK